MHLASDNLCRLGGLYSDKGLSAALRPSSLEPARTLPSRRTTATRADSSFATTHIRSHLGMTCSSKYV